MTYIYVGTVALQSVLKHLMHSLYKKKGFFRPYDGLIYVTHLNTNSLNIIVWKFWAELEVYFILSS